MLSSTSSSERAPHTPFEVLRGGKARRSVWAIVVGVFIIGLTSEAVTFLGAHHVSKILRRTVGEYDDAAKVKLYSAEGKPTMLLFGNSLLLEGVDYPALRSALAAEIDVHRLIFEQTGYLDKYYVLRTLFRHGARPSHVVVCISVNELIGNEARGEFMSRYMDASDIASLGRRQHMDATMISSLLFAHVSGWFAYRAETRKVVLGAVMPDMRDLAVRLAWVRAQPATSDLVKVEAAPRLAELRALCDEYGSRLTILVPPTLVRDDHADVLASLGKEAGIRVVVPVQSGSLDASFFRDGHHLTSAGAAIFTAKLEPQLAHLAR